ncbi:RNA-directed DNA polymerase, eukaryota, reverse transcriptase zinc-binding domain protein [Tanacetum coccineum]
MMDLNIAAWNIRGLGKITKQNEVKKLICNEKLSICAVLETYMKKDRIDRICMNLFGSWSWQHNERKSRKGCRIDVGWDSNSVKCFLINSTEQSMLYNVEVLSTQEACFCTFIYAANKGRDMKELWKELNLNKRVVGNKAWVIMGDINVRLNLEDHYKDKVEFNDVVKKNWDVSIQGHTMYKLVKKLKNLKPYLNKLNWKNGNLFGRVTDLKTKLHSIQSNIDKDPTNKALREEGVEILSKFKEACEDEEKLLKQKTKITWLKEGDKNSAFFHKVLRGRLNKNKIMSVCAEDGKKYDNCDVGEQFVKYFEGFLGISTKVNKMMDVEVLFDRKISMEEANLVIREVQDIEIKKALFDIDDDKAPGPEGFTSTFFKKSWEFVNKDFCTAIKEFFSSGKLLGEVNATLISLVPKSLTPQKVSDFRPIACCNVVYKCISKILTNRIKSALNQIVDDNQSDFVPRRAITDNILLTQELLKGYNCINGPIRVSFKTDIPKAYDAVNWNFIEDMLQNFGFPYKIIKWIMICITTPKFTICVNVMEVLNLLVRNEIKKESAFKYHFRCKQMKITHLCFADDLIMLCHGDRSLNEETRNEISSIFPFKEGKLPVRYLGVPLVTKKIGITDYKQLIDKVNQKLSD